MAEEKKTTSTRAKSTTTKSSTAKTTAAKKTTTTKTTATKTTATKSTTAKPATSKLTAEEREKKEALRKEVLEHYTRQQNYRATTPSYIQPPVYTYNADAEEDYVEEDHIEDNYVEESDENISPIPTSEQYVQDRNYVTNSVYTRNEATMAAEPRLYEPEARAHTPRETLEPTSISTNPKITSLNSKRDPYRKEKIKEAVKGFLVQDGLFYFFGLIALIGVIVIMLG